jgi:hypothetical protein
MPLHAVQMDESGGIARSSSIMAAHRNIRWLKVRMQPAEVYVWWRQNIAAIAFLPLYCTSCTVHVQHL